MRVVVVGGGISGLAAAHLAAREFPRAEVIVCEQSDRVGGKLRTGELAGHPIDVGAEALLTRRPEGIDLIASAGLADARIDPLTTSAGLWVDGAVRRIPTGNVMGIPGDLAAVAAVGVLSDSGLARLSAETAHPALTDDISVGELVSTRLGPEVTARLVDPLLGGVYAGRAERISLRAAIPALAAELGRRDGTLLDAAAAVATAGRRPGLTTPVFTSVAGGLGRLPTVLGERGGFEVRTSTAVRALSRGVDGGFVLATGSRHDERHLSADAVILATPAGKTANLLADLTPAAALELAAVPTASVAIVSMAFALDGDFALPAGSGMLIPAGQGVAVKGVTISSQKWPGAPAGLAFVRASLGRVGDEFVLQREDDELIDLVRADLGVLLAVTAAPVDATVTRWGGGLPQYEVGHVEMVARVRAAVAAIDGLAVAGATYDGVGIPACIASARAAVTRVAEHLTRSAVDNEGHGRR